MMYCIDILVHWSLFRGRELSNTVISVHERLIQSEREIARLNTENEELRNLIKK